jgi:hypothetical protein
LASIEQGLVHLEKQSQPVSLLKAIAGTTHLSNPIEGYFLASQLDYPI